MEALKIFGLSGGVGARNRRGFGSMSLLKLESDFVDVDWQSPRTASEYAQQLSTILRRNITDEPELRYTAFGRAARIEVVDGGSNSCAMLDNLGRLMQRYRGWGRYGRVNGEPSEKRFIKDHDWYLYWKLFSNPNDRDYSQRVNDRQTRPDGSVAPRRLVFGLPQNYLDNVSIVGPTIRGNDQIDRRASPLFTHIHKFGVNSYATVLTLLPSRFLPEANVDIAFRQERHPQSFNPDFSVISDFFDGVRTSGARKGQPYFVGKTPVWPA